MHLNPCEAQWVIDLAYVVWDEDPEEPAPEPPKGLDAALAGRCVLLVEQAGSPSHNAKASLEASSSVKSLCGAGYLTCSLIAGLLADALRQAAGEAVRCREAAPQVVHGPGADAARSALLRSWRGQELLPPGRLQEQEEVHLHA